MLHHVGRCHNGRSGGHFRTNREELLLRPGERRRQIRHGCSGLGRENCWRLVATLLPLVVHTLATSCSLMQSKAGATALLLLAQLQAGVLVPREKHPQIQSLSPKDCPANESHAMREFRAFQGAFTPPPHLTKVYCGEVDARNSRETGGPPVEIHEIDARVSRVSGGTPFVLTRPQRWWYGCFSQTSKGPFATSRFAQKYQWH